MCGAMGLGCHCPFGSHVHERDRHFSGGHGGRGGRTGRTPGTGWVRGPDFPPGQHQGSVCTWSLCFLQCLPTGMSVLPHARKIAPHSLDEQSPSLSLTHWVTTWCGPRQLPWAGVLPWFPRSPSASLHPQTPRRPSCAHTRGNGLLCLHECDPGGRAEQQREAGADGGRGAQDHGPQETLRECHNRPSEHVCAQRPEPAVSPLWPCHGAPLHSSPVCLSPRATAEPFQRGL